MATMAHEADDRDESAPSANWIRHEHTSAPLEKQPREVVKQATHSEEITGHIKDGAQAEQAPSQAKDELATRYGFTSYLQMFEEAVPLREQDKQGWMLVGLKNHRWLLWLDSDPRNVYQFNEYDTREDAEQAFRQLSQ